MIQWPWPNRSLTTQCALGLVGSTGYVVGLDPSAGMLHEARKGPCRNLIQGVGEELPFPDASFDFLSMGYALRHVSDLHVAFREYRRVLRPGGIVLLLEVSRPRSAALLARVTLLHQDRHGRGLRRGDRQPGHAHPDALLVGHDRVTASRRRPSCRPSTTCRLRRSAACRSCSAACSATIARSRPDRIGTRPRRRDR